MKLLTILLLAICIETFAQKENNIWYFGDKAGIDFNYSNPIVLTNSSMQSLEGTATISDSSGNLLFYTNGGSHNLYLGAVWNKIHAIMPNGDLDNAGGCNSSAQSSLIVPNPNNSNQFYVFTTDCQENSMIGGFRYSIVDMTLDGGLGDITLKGIQICDSVAESICGIKHINGNDYWVIVHKLNNNSFYVYQITNSGISSPVITNLGLAAYSNAGQMIASVDGSKIGYSAIGKTMLFDFDNSTGILSNYINLNKYTFGCSFSANCRFFYACYNAAPYDKIYQFDLYASNIPASVFEIANSTGTNGLNNMQLAPNGKIYIARMNSNYLDVINNPDLSDTLSNYIANDFYLGGQLSKGGLPNFINGLFGQCSFNIGIEANYVSNSNFFNVYPNPFHSSTTLEFKNLKNEKHNLTVYNTCGHILLLINNINTNKIKIERTNLTDGLYFFQLRTERQIIATGKFIIE